MDRILNLGPSDERILIVAPFGQDGQMAADLLGQARMTTHICRDIAELCAEFPKGAGALLIAYEALSDDAIENVGAALEQQPAWSDIPVFVFMPSTASPLKRHLNGTLDRLRNVTLLERPVRVAALVSSLKSALRARRRQYLVGALLEELRTSHQAKDAFVAAVSHELRTPLNAILGWTGMLRRSSDPARAATAVDAIERNGSVLTQLVEDLLDVARIATGQFRLTTGPVDVLAAVRAAVEAVLPAAEAKGVELRLSLPDDAVSSEGTWVVRGDAVRLQQVVWNVLWNAVKFTDDGGSVTVDVRHARRSVAAHDAGAIDVVITDTGAGIAPELLPHVFEAFRQGANTDGTRKSGLGLGLAIVRHLVELHGGTVTAQSDGPGRGATFTIRLPALAAAGGEAQVSPLTHTAAASHDIRPITRDRPAR